MAGELPVDLRTWRKEEDHGRGTPADGTASPNDCRTELLEGETSLGSTPTPGRAPSADPKGAQPSPGHWSPGSGLSGGQNTASPQAGLEGEKKAAETSLPLRKRRYAVQGADGETQGPLAGKVPKTENSEGEMELWGPPRNGCCPSYIPVGYSRLPAAYYSGLAASFLGHELTPVLPPMAPHHLLGVSAPYSLLCPLQTQLSLDIVTATKQDEDGDTPLHIAVVQENLPVARHLVGLFHQGQRDLDAFNNLRQTPLHLAVITSQPALVKLLVAHGASPMVLDRNGQTALHLACEHGSLRCLQEMLEGSPSPLDLEARNFEGFTPLHIAVATSNRDMVLTLSKHGADVDAVDIKSGRSPLLHAVENNSLEMVELLLQHGANVNAQSYGGNTALHAASGRGFLDVLRLLVRSGADSTLKNYHNDTPLMVAKNKRVTDILRGKAAGLYLPPDHIQEGASPASGSPSSRPAHPSLMRASPESCPTPPSPIQTPKPLKAGQGPVLASQHPAIPNRTSVPVPSRGVKLERSPTPPTPEQAPGFRGTPKFFLPLPETMMDPTFHSTFYPFSPSGQSPAAHHVPLLPVHLNPSVLPLPLASQMHPRTMGLDQRTPPPAENLPGAGCRGQRLHGRDSGPGGS